MNILRYAGNYISDLFTADGVRSFTPPETYLQRAQRYSRAADIVLDRQDRARGGAKSPDLLDQASLFKDFRRREQESSVFQIAALRLSHFMDNYRAGTIIEGDIVRMTRLSGESQDYMFAGINDKGGPGQPGIPTPFFYDLKTGNVHSFSFQSFPSAKKVGHQTHEEWEARIAEIQQELAGNS